MSNINDQTPDDDEHASADCQRADKLPRASGPQQGLQAHPKRGGGPGTVAGKMKSSRNSITSGLTSASPVAGGETEEEWETFIQGCREDLHPVGVLEEALVANIAMDLWRKRRIQRYETGIVRTRFEAIHAEPPPPLDEQSFSDNGVDLEVAINLLHGLDGLTDSSRLGLERAVDAVIIIVVLGCHNSYPDWLRLPGEDWTVGDLRRWITALADHLGSTPRNLVSDTIKETHRILDRKRKRLIAQEQRERLALMPDANNLGLILRYEAARDRSLHRNLSDLEVLQRARTGEPLPPPIRVEVSEQ